MKNWRSAIRIGLSTCFLFGFFAILLHVHKRDFQKRDVHKTCIACLLQYNTIPLKPELSAIQGAFRDFRYTRPPVTKLRCRIVDRVFEANNPNKAPPSR